MCQRFVAGLGVGISFTILPMYLGEIAEDSNRGALCSLTPQMMNIGGVVTCSIGLWVSLEALAFVGVILPVVFALIFVWMPDTPYYLIMKKRSGDAEKSLSWLRGTSDVKETLKNIEEHIENEETESGKVMDLFKTSGNRKVCIQFFNFLYILTFEFKFISYNTPGRRYHDCFDTGTTVPWNWSSPFVQYCDL